MLTKVILEENHTYTDKQLQVLYANKINTKITVAELQGIVQNITNYYRNNGYILSRAVLPPQHVHAGIVHIRIVEGYIDQVKVIGDAKGSKKILEAYGLRISQSRPLRIQVMEHYLRLANEVPGVTVKAVLEPSKGKVGASDLNLAANMQRITGSLSYDNYGSLYIGPNEGTFNVAVNSMLRSG